MVRRNGGAWQIIGTFESALHPHRTFQALSPAQGLALGLSENHPAWPSGAPRIHYPTHELSLGGYRRCFALTPTAHRIGRPKGERKFTATNAFARLPLNAPRSCPVAAGVLRIGALMKRPQP